MAKLGLGNGVLAGFLALTLAATFSACSDEQGSQLDDDDDSGGGRAGGSGGATLNSGGSGDTSSTSGGNGSGAGGSGSGSTSGNSGSGNSSSGGGGGTINVDACPGIPTDSPVGMAGAAGASCLGYQFEPERMPVDMFIMLDRSISMIEHNVTVNGEEVTRWAAVTQAVEQFVNDPAAADIRMGLGIFSYSGSDNETVECDASLYAEPKVEIGPPADVGDEIVQYIRDLETNFQLGGFTPTAAALEGAILHAKDWASDNLMRRTVVVLVTDGMPTQCTTDVSQIAELAAWGQSEEGGPRIATYVVGVQGAWNLQQIAQQGGTEAYVVGETGDAAAQFVEALINITDNPMGCEFEIGDPANPDELIVYSEVSMIYTPTATGDTEEIPRARDYSDCLESEYGGWYYDDEAAASDDDPDTKPSKILVCPCTCARLGVGNMTLRFGCEPRFVIG